MGLADVIDWPPVFPVSALRLASSQRDGWVVVTVRGPVGAADIPLFDGMIDAGLARGGRRMIVDLRAATEVDILALAVLAKAKAKAGPKHLRLVVPRYGSTVFTDLEPQRWQLYASVDEAVGWP